MQVEKHPGGMKSQQMTKVVALDKKTFERNENSVEDRDRYSRQFKYVVFEYPKTSGSFRTLSLFCCNKSTINNGLSYLIINDLISSLASIFLI